MSIDETQKKARNKWDAANMTVLGCKVRKDRAEEFKAACKEAGTSPNAVFSNAINDFMERPRQEPAPTGRGDPYGLDQEKLQQHTQETGETVPAFLNRAVDETIGRDHQLAAIMKDQKKIHG